MINHQIKNEKYHCQYLICDICNEKVYDYKTCQNNCIYCSYDCLSVLMLNNMNNQEYTDFNS